VDARIETTIEGVSIGVVRIEDLRVGPAPEALKGRTAERIEKLRETFGGEEDVKKMVRSILRFGKYKPSGRGKPASEYLLESAREGSFPSINNAVDALNFVSLGSGLPISLIDTAKAGTHFFRLRRGREGESFVFNRSGQVLQLQDLILISALPSDEPLATPVKDCQKTKVDEETTEALAVIYSPKGMAAGLREAAEELASEMSAFSKAESAAIVGA